MLSAVAVLGAIHGKFTELQETARNFHLPEDVRQNITANLANARDFMGLSAPAAAASAGGEPPRPDAGAAAPSLGRAPAAQPAAESR